MSTLLKGSAIYTLGSLLRQLVSFLMLPIYTRYLTPADYGVAEMLAVITAILAIIAGTHIGVATIRFYHEAPSERERKLVINTASITTLLTTSTVYLMLLAFSFSALGTGFSLNVLGSSEHLILLQLFGLIIIFQPVEEQLFTLLRVQNRPWVFVAISLGRLLVQLGLNIYFVVFAKLGVTGVVYSAVISGGIAAAISFVTCRVYSGSLFSRPLSVKILKYIAPLAFGGLGGLYISVSDRYAIQFFRNTDDVGLYALGYRFADIVSVVGWLPFLNIWQAYRFEIAKKSGAQDEFHFVFCAISAYLIWIGLGVALLTDDVLRLMSTPSYWPAASVTAPLILSLLLGCAVGFANFSFLISGRTAFIAKGSWLSAAILTIAFILLVPAYGAVGAAWAKVLANAVLLVVTVYWAKSIYPMNLPWWRVSALLALSVGIYVGIEYFSSITVVSLAVSVFFLAAFPFGILFFPVLPLSSRELIKQTLIELRASSREFLNFTTAKR